MNSTDTAALKREADRGDPECQYKLGEYYISCATHELVEEGKDYLKKAAMRNHLAAKILLGDTLIKSLCAPASTYRAGAMWYLRAAEQHSPVAQSRLGALSLRGIGVPESDVDAFHWYKKAADAGDPRALCNLAYLCSTGVGHAKDERTATSCYLKAAIEGEPRAWYNLGIRYARGIGAVRDAAYACAFLEQAAAKNYPGSTAALKEARGTLTEQQIDDPQNISATLVERLTEQSDPLLSMNTAIRCGNTPDAEKDAEHELLSPPARTEVVSWQPRVVKIHDFLSMEECNHLIDIAMDHAGPSESLVDDRLGKSLGTSFSGHTALLDMAHYDPVLCLIERRIAEATRIPEEHGEWISILGYGTGQSYAPHVDFFVTEESSGQHVFEHVGQRLITFLMYLSDVEEGGETVYTEAGISVAPRQGMAVMHYNCLPDGAVDPLTVHTSLPVVRGTKWLARKAICQRRLYNVDL